MQPLFKWAITSSGKIASDFAHAIRQLPGHAVVAVAARRVGDADAFVRAHCPGDVATFGSYDEMFGSRRVHGADATYVATHPASHLAVVSASVRAGNPTLCEKPLAVRSDEVAALYALARREGCFLMEGMWTRCFPATVAAREVLASGAIGSPVGVSAEFGYDVSNGCPASLRGDPETGGISQDIGVYMAEKALLAFPPCEHDCVDARATAVFGYGDGVDLSVAASLRFAPRGGGGGGGRGRGGVASLLWTGQCDTPETATILGTAGALVFGGPAHTPTRLTVRTRASRTENAEEVLDFPLPDDDGAHDWRYPGSIALQYEAAAVADALKRGLLEAPEWTAADSIAAHAMIAAVKRDIDDGTPADARAADVAHRKPGDGDP